MTIPRLIISVLSLCLISFIFFIGVANGNNGYKKANYTGQQLFDAINEFRVKNNKKPVPIALYMCDNLIERYLKIKSGDVGHEGFDEWVKKEEIDKNYIVKAEVYIKDTYTTKDAIDWWNGSPGHRLALLGDYDAGCAYANEGVGVAVFGNTLPNSGTQTTRPVSNNSVQSSVAQITQATSAPIQTKVPVALSSGNTYQCDQIAVQAVRDADSAYQRAEQEKSQCRSKYIQQDSSMRNSCIDTCNSVYNSVTQPSERSNCVDKCYNDYKNLSKSSSNICDTYSSSQKSNLDSLTSRYCK